MDDELHGLEWLAQRVKAKKVLSPLDDMDIKIIRAAAIYNLNVTEISKAVYLHRNSIVHRVKRIKEKTGCSPLDFFWLCKLLVLVDKLGGEKKHGKA